jgi:hypothetical protein
MRLLRDQGTTGKFAADRRDVYLIDDDPGIRSALGRLFRSSACMPSLRPRTNSGGMNCLRFRAAGRPETRAGAYLDVILSASFYCTHVFADKLV